MNINEDNSDRIFYNGGYEYYKVLTQDNIYIYIYAFAAIVIPPLARAWYMVLRNMHMEIESLANNGYSFWNAADDSTKLINKLKPIIPKKTTQDNAPPTAISPFH